MAALAAFSLAMSSAAVALLAPGMGPPGVGLPGSVCDTGCVSGLAATAAGDAPEYDMAALPDADPLNRDTDGEIASATLVASDGGGERDSADEATERGGGDARTAV